MSVEWSIPDVGSSMLDDGTHSMWVIKDPNQWVWMNFKKGMIGVHNTVEN